MSLNQTHTPIKLIKFKDGTPVPTTTQIKYLGSVIAWIKPFETAFQHTAALADWV